MRSKQDIFSEINTHLLQDEVPSYFVNCISDDPLFNEYPFEMLSRLKKTKQSPKFHPEGSVWNHTMLVIDAASKVKSKSKNVKAFMWAALLHDIGKPDTTIYRNERVTSYDHDKFGAKMTEKFLEEFTDDYNLIENVVSLVRYHMQILFVVNNLPFAEVKAMKDKVDINEVALLGLCDRLGRLGVDKEKEEKNINIFIEKCR